MFRLISKLVFLMVITVLLHAGWCCAGEKAAWVAYGGPGGFWEYAAGDAWPAAELVDNYVAAGVTRIYFIEQTYGAFYHLFTGEMDYAFSATNDMDGRDFLRELLVQAAAHNIKVMLVWATLPVNYPYPGTENIPTEEGGPIRGLNDQRLIDMYNDVIDDLAVGYADYIGPSHGNILEGITFQEMCFTEQSDTHTDDVTEFTSYCYTTFNETYTTGTMPTVDANDKWWRRYYLYKASLVNNFMAQLKTNAAGHNLKTGFCAYLPDAYPSWGWGNDIIGLEDICDDIWVPRQYGTSPPEVSLGYKHINNCSVDFMPGWGYTPYSPEHYVGCFNGCPVSFFETRTQMYTDEMREFYLDTYPNFTYANGDYFNDLLGVSERELSLYFGQDNTTNWLGLMDYWQGGVSPVNIAVAVNPNPFIMKYPTSNTTEYNSKVLPLTRGMFPYANVDGLILGSRFALDSASLQRYSLIIIPEEMGEGLSQATVTALTNYKNAGGKILVVATPLTQSNPDLTGGVDQTSTFCGLTITGNATSTSVIRPTSSTLTLNNPDAGRWVDGQTGKALSFDGVDDYVNCGAGSSLDITDKLTIEAWIKPDTRPGQHVIACKGGSTYYFSTCDGKLALLIGKTTPVDWQVTLVGNTVLNANSWYHVAGTYDSATGIANLYVNGTLDRSITVATPQAIRSLPAAWLSVGSAMSYNNNLYNYNGVIDELNIYPVALSADEIDQHYQESRINGQWLFDDSEGMFLQDASGRRNMGYLNNMDGNSCWTTGKIGGCLAFDGTDDYVDCGAGSTLNITEPLTLEAWVKFDSLTDEAMPLNNGLYRLIYSSTDGKLHFQYRITANAAGGDSQWNYWSGVKTTTTIQTGQWYHVTGIKTGNTMKLYLNSVKERELNCLSGYTVDNSQFSNLVLGNDPFCGKLDEVKVYASTLNDDTVSRHAQQPIAARWALDETSGTTATDRSGNGNNATLTNMTPPGCWVNGKIGKALSFDGVDDYVNCGAGSSLNITDKLTIEAWIKPEDTGPGHHVIACKGGSTYFFSILGDKLTLLIGRTTPVDWQVTLVDNTALTAGNWYHVAGTYDSATGIANLYVNGALRRSITVAAPQPIRSLPTTWLSVGSAMSYYNGYYFNGVIDELNIYPVALSADEIARHSSLLTAGQWTMNEGTGTSVQDNSGHSVAGTMNNFSCPSPMQFMPLTVQPTRRKTINNTGATVVVSDYSTGDPLLLQKNNDNVYFSTIGCQGTSSNYFGQVISCLANPPIRLAENTGIMILQTIRKDNVLCISLNGPGTATLKVDTGACGLSGSTFAVKEILTGRTIYSSVSSASLNSGFKVNIKYPRGTCAIAIGTANDLAGFTGIFASEEAFERTYPDSWTTYINDSLDSAAGWARDYCHSGMRSLKIQRTLSRTAGSSWVGKTINLPATPNYPTTFTLGGWARGDSIGAGARCALRYDIVYGDNTTGTYDVDTRFTTGTYDWQQVNHVETFDSEYHQGVKSITPKCVLEDTDTSTHGDANGTVWFDDLYVILNGKNLLYNGDAEILK